MKTLIILFAVLISAIIVPSIILSDSSTPAFEFIAYQEDIESTVLNVGEFIDLTIYVSDCTLSTLTLPVHFNKDVVEIWAVDESQKVADGVFDQTTFNAGDVGVAQGQVFDPLNWDGDLVFNSVYPAVNNSEGLMKIVAYRTSERAIIRESVLTIHFKVISEGNPEIRFASDSDDYYDMTAPAGARIFNNSGELVFDEIIPVLSAVDQNKRTINFISNGGSEVASIRDDINTVISLPVSTLEGYTLEGWYTEPELVNKVDFPYTITDDATFYARWTINQYIVGFEENGGSEVAAITDDYQTVIQESPESSLTGYSFEGWYTEPELVNKVDFPYTIEDDVTFYARWTINQYTVDFTENGGSEVAAIIDDYQTVIQESPESSLTGYTLEGWYMEPELTNKVDFPYTIEDDVTFYAKWTINQYTVSFTENGGSEVTDITDDYQSVIPESPETALTENVFEGWYTEPELVNKVTFPYTITSDVTLYAKWITNQYTISFITNGGSATSSLTQAFGSSITSEPGTLKTGYTFTGWYFDIELSNRATFPYTITGNRTLYAKWTINQYTVTFAANGGSAVSSITQSYGSSIENIPATSRSGYTFAGWYSEAQLSNQVAFPYTVTGNKTLYAKWDAIVVAAPVFSGGGGSKILSIRINSLIAENEINRIIENNEERIYVIETKSSVVKKLTVTINGLTMKQLYDNHFMISVKTPSITYLLTVEKEDITKMLDGFKLTESSLNNISIDILVEQIEEETDMQTDDYEVVIAPVRFTMTAKTGYISGLQKQAEIIRFKNYVERIIELPADTDISKVTTAVLMNEDGSLSHIPTVVYTVMNKSYVKFKSFSNSVYLVVYHPVTVDSVENHWSKAIVNDMASRVVISEYEQFNPNEIITRGQFADYITRALGIYRTGAARKLFIDVATKDQYADAITVAVDYGIINGYPDSTFRTDNKISREEAMLMFARAMDVIGLEEIDNQRIDNYIDKGTVSNWAYEGVRKTLSVKVFNGRTADTIVPKGTFTHAEAATAIHNLLIEAGLIE
ncbi:MAG: InlB B-repeat-containing protein [Clostridia bacterium]|nr:InlB B-repeat-containing protein [Clostridia bacterium]